MADSSGSTKAPEADIREEWDELANGRNGRKTADPSNIRDQLVARPLRP
jgi:hypothetical protein